MNDSLATLTPREQQKRRIRLINSLLGATPVHLVGTQSAEGIPTFAVFSATCHISSDPARIGIMSRPDSVEHDTYRNIRETGQFTLNEITRPILKCAHESADRIPGAESKFSHNGLTPRYWPGFTAPAVAESPLRIGLRLIEAAPISCSATVLLVGEICQLALPKESLHEDDSPLTSDTGCLSSMGLDAHASANETAGLEYRSFR